MSILSLPISIGGELGGAMAGDLVNALLNLVASTARSLLKDLMNALSNATAVSPDEGNSWFASVAHLLFPVEAMVVAPLLFAATIGAILHQDMRRLARVWCAGLPLSLLGGFAIVKLAFVGLTVTDQLSALLQAEVAPHLGTDFIKRGDIRGKRWFDRPRG